MSKLSDIVLGAALLAGSTLYCLLTGSPGHSTDITPLLFTVPIALVFIATDLKRIIRKEHMKMAVEIRNVRGHYEAYIGGKFICSGDTRSECAEAAEDFYSDDAA